MPGTTELIEFRRAFVWLLCGMLLPSVALVAFGVVAVANERAAVERRLAEDYDARLQVLERELFARLDQAAEAVAAGRTDSLIASVAPAPDPGEVPALADPERRVEYLPPGGHVFVGYEAQGDRQSGALVRTAGPTELAQFDMAALIGEMQRLARNKFPNDRANFRLTPAREPVAAPAA